MEHQQCGTILSLFTSLRKKELSIKKMDIKSVKKVVILGAADVKETYNNVKILFNAVNINSIKVQLAVDLKMANIVLGLQNHKSVHSCYICTAANPFKEGVDWEQVCYCDKVDCRKVGNASLILILSNILKSVFCEPG